MVSEKDLIFEVQNGNQEAFELLIKQNSGLIWCIVKKFYGRGYDLEDLYQVGSIGFIKAIKRFNLEYNFKLSTFAVPYILGEIKRYIRDDGIIKISRSMKKDCKIIVESINESFTENGYEEKAERIIFKNDEQTKIVDRLTLDDIVNKLSLRDRTIIKLRYFKEKTQDQVAKILGISQVQVSRIEKKILNNMKEKMVM